MNKIFITILVIVALGVVFFSPNNKEDRMMKQDETMKQGEMMTDEKQEMMMRDEASNVKMMGDESSMKQSEMMGNDNMRVAGSYEVYDVSKLAKAETGKVVLFFRASWCPACRSVDADIRANLSKIPKGVTILDVNYDTFNDLKKKYGVTYQHTFVQVDKDGNLINKWSGGETLTSVLSNIK